MPTAHLSFCDLTSQLDELLSANCDPEFDAVYEDLDREFAHRRLHFSDGGSDA
ncbi:MAG TPA: hypothetical protein VG826_15040 [Pirellulales bacterium]|nr:hypothetical protein [Pirellulales bacterium]